MKKQLSFVALLVIICTLFSTLIGCSSPTEPKEKSFSKAGLTITLTDEFYEQDIITQTANYVSEDVIVTTLKEDGSKMADYTVTEYAKLVCTVNDLDPDDVVTKSGYAEFTYEREANGKDIYFYARCFKNGTDFWLVQFACEIKNKDKCTPSFEKWASSVTFED